MLSNPSPDMMPIKAFKSQSKTAMKAASADPAMADAREQSFFTILDINDFTAHAFPKNLG